MYYVFSHNVMPAYVYAFYMITDRVGVERDFKSIKHYREQMLSSHRAELLFDGRRAQRTCLKNGGGKRCYKKWTFSYERL